MKFNALLSILFIYAIVFTGCGKDAVDEGPQLEGRWEVEEARRNGRLTESLRGLYFDFGQEGSFTTNISGMDENGRYEVSENSIATSEVQLSLDYKINELSDSTLELTSVFQDYRFFFRFRRIADQALNPPS